jgi:toxin ParE1/3/4
MRLRYTLPALAELDAILDYIATHSPQGAARINGRIHTMIDLLLAYPRIGQQTDDPTTRRVGTSPYPYLIFYEIAAEEIVIHGIRHGARNPSAMPGSTR